MHRHTIYVYRYIIYIYNRDASLFYTSVVNSPTYTFENKGKTYKVAVLHYEHKDGVSCFSSLSNCHCSKLRRCKYPLIRLFKTCGG